MKFRIFDLTSYFQVGGRQPSCYFTPKNAAAWSVHSAYEASASPISSCHELVCFVSLVFNLIIFTVVIGC